MVFKERMTGGVEPAPWWASSHERVLTAARAADWPSQAIDVESLTCEIVGGELYDCFQSHAEGHHPNQWLAALAERAAEDQAPRSLLQGIALITPDRRLAPTSVPGSAPVSGSAGHAVAGPPLMARDEYGSRFLLVAPFGYGEQNPGQGRTVDHWYAWDLDLCWLDTLVSAGVFGSADEALSAWRLAVGEDEGEGAADATLSECAPAMTGRLLMKSLEAGLFAAASYSDPSFSGMTRETDSPDLTREYFRQRRRAREVSESLGAGASAGGTFTVDLDKVRDEFLAWYASRHGGSAASDTVGPGVTGDMADAVDTITDQWGPHKDVDDRAFYACSPHRIETARRLIRAHPYAGPAEPAIRLLPEWAQWCLERGGLSDGRACR